MQTINAYIDHFLLNLSITIFFDSIQKESIHNLRRTISQYEKLCQRVN